MARSARSTLAVAAGPHPKPHPRDPRIAQQASSSSAPGPGSHPTTSIAGSTLSDRGPAIGAAAEATLALFYAGIAVASVRQPTQPAAEITMTGGVRPTIGNINLDFGVAYFAYPGEAMPGPTNGVDYWELSARADTRIGEAFRVAGGYAYAPDVSKTGAWGQYAAAGIGFEVPSRLLPRDISVSFTGGAGYSWFGNQAAALGGFPLPAYLNWQAGVTMARKNVQPRPALPRHQSVEGELLRLHRRSQRAAGRSPRSCHQSRRPHLWLVRRSLRREALVRVELSPAIPSRDVFPGRRGDRVSAELSQAERESGRGRGGPDHGAQFHARRQCGKRRRSGRRPRSACRSHRVQCRVGHHRCGVLPDGQLRSAATGSSASGAQSHRRRTKPRPWPRSEASSIPIWHRSRGRKTANTSTAAFAAGCSKNGRRAAPA